MKGEEQHTPADKHGNPHTFVKDPIFPTSKQATIYLNLLSKDFIKSQGIKQDNTFEWGGRVFMMDYHSAAQKFAWNNPDGGDFYVWCQDKIRHTASAPDLLRENLRLKEEVERLMLEIETHRSIYENWDETLEIWNSVQSIQGDLGDAYEERDKANKEAATLREQKKELIEALTNVKDKCWAGPKVITEIVDAALSKTENLQPPIN